MKLKYCLIYTILCFIHFVSCETTLLFTKGDNIIMQPRAMTMEDEHGTWLMEKFELDRIVQIETTDDYIMGGFIRRVIKFEDKLIILCGDTNTIFVVDAYTGKVATHIDRKGRGPGESRIIVDIAFDYKNQEILVFNDYRKLLYFSMDGVFLKEENVTDRLYTNILYEDDNLMFYIYGFGVSRHSHSVEIYNLTTRTWTSVGKDSKINFDLRFAFPFIVKSKNIWFIPVLDMGLHKLDGDTIKVPYSLEANNPLTSELLRKSNRDWRAFRQEVRERRILYLIQGVRETEKYLVFATNLGVMIIDKQTLETQGAERVVDEFLGLRMDRLNYFPHDGDDNMIMFVVNHIEWARRRPTSDDIPERVKVQIDAVQLDDKIESNPIFVFYKERN